MSLLCDRLRKLPIFETLKTFMEYKEVLVEVLDDLQVLLLHEQLLLPYELIHDEVFVNLLRGLELYE